jgi:hypothetical protein
MITGRIAVQNRTNSVCYSALILGAWLLGSGTAGAQQYLANARQKCADQVTVTAPGMSAQVRPFESRSADVTSPTLSWQCGGQPQPDIQCPANTNRILIDRSQGGSVFSVVCLQK